MLVETLEAVHLFKAPERLSLARFCQDHGSPFHEIGLVSFLEVTKVLEHLASSNMNGLDFHVVAPSLPNFDFSSRVSTPGFGLRQYSKALSLPQADTASCRVDNSDPLLKAVTA